MWLAKVSASSYLFASCIVDMFSIRVWLCCTTMSCLIPTVVYLGVGYNLPSITFAFVFECYLVSTLTTLTGRLGSQITPLFVAPLKGPFFDVGSALPVLPLS